MPCVIPFWYNGKQYNGCTDVNSKDIGENTWCATVATSENDKEDFDIAYGVCSGDLACKRHNGTNVNSNIILHQYGITNAAAIGPKRNPRVKTSEAFPLFLAL